MFPEGPEPSRTSRGRFDVHDGRHVRSTRSAGAALASGRSGGEAPRSLLLTTEVKCRDCLIIKMPFASFRWNSTLRNGAHKLVATLAMS